MSLMVQLVERRHPDLGALIRVMVGIGSGQGSWMEGEDGPPCALRSQRHSKPFARSGAKEGSYGVTAVTGPTEGRQAGRGRPASRARGSPW